MADSIALWVVIIVGIVQLLSVSVGVGIIWGRFEAVRRDVAEQKVDLQKHLTECREDNKATLKETQRISERLARLEAVREVQ